MYAIIGIMTDIIWLIICVIVALLAGFAIPVLIELKRTVAQARDFLESTEKSLNTSLNEMDETLKSVRGITDTINTVTDDIGSFSSSLSETGQNLREIFETLQDSTENLSRNIVGIKAGIHAALDVLLNRLLIKRGKHHE